MRNALFAFALASAFVLAPPAAHAAEPAAAAVTTNASTAVTTTASGAASGDESTTPPDAKTPAPVEGAEPDFFERLDGAFGKYLVGPLASVLFFDLIFWDNAVEPESDRRALPFIVAWLVFGAVLFTVRMRFINVRAFRHALDVTAGKYDDPSDPGEVSHFQALSSALSATVGLGNIAGVAVMGGPGAVFWMILAGFLGMSSKFTECTLGQMYRSVDAQGKVLGGPMRYLSIGLGELNMPRLGRVLAVLFAVMCIGGSLGGGNMFQANQSYAAVADVVPLLEGRAWLYGLLLAFLVGIVIIGGIRRIGRVAGYIVPAMCGVYLLAGAYILVTHAAQIPAAFGEIIGQAFTPAAGYGGLVGVLVMGFRRAAFSNEAGIGSASIAHSAAATDEPVREGVVALLEPFIDTVIVCTMTALVVVVTGAYQTNAGDGILMTSVAFGKVIPWFPVVLSFAVFLFAYSTMISWSYYGERCWMYLFGGWSMAYRFLFLVFVFLGAVLKLGNVIDFSDLMVLGMAFPNILGLILLSGKVKTALDDYWNRYRTGAMPQRGGAVPAPDAPK